MKKLLPPFMLVTLCLFIDQVSKLWALKSVPFWQNQGIIFGLYSELPSIHRGVFLTTLYALIFVSLMLFLYLCPAQFKNFQRGIPVLLGGMGGNVWDRIVLGHSVDFIRMPFFEDTIIVFNLADAFQWLGAFMILHALWQYGAMPLTNRGRLIVLPFEQMHMARKYAAFSFFTALVFSLFGASYLRASLALTPATSVPWNQLLISYALGSLFLAVTCAIGSFFAGLYLAHRSAGALYAFERHIRSLMAGDDMMQFNLRSDDRYQHLVKLAHDLKEHLDKKAG